MILTFPNFVISLHYKCFTYIEKYIYHVAAFDIGMNLLSRIYIINDLSDLSHMCTLHW